MDLALNNQQRLKCHQTQPIVGCCREMCLFVQGLYYLADLELKKPKQSGHVKFI